MGTTGYRVGVLMYDGCFASEAFGVVDLLTLANRVTQFGGEPAPFITSMHAAGPRTISVSGGTGLRAARMSYGLDLLVVPGFDLELRQDIARRLAGLPDEVAALRRASSRGVPLASICVGAFLLGAAGLLDGRRATTAWLFADELAERHPGTHVDKSALLVEDGPVTTTGAFSAAQDLALHLIRLRAGAAVARTTAMVALAAPGRTTQAPYIDETLRENASQAFSARVRHDLLADLGQAYDLAALASAHHVSTRTMLRRFRAETGQTPLDFLQTARISRAKLLLESTSLSVSEIARAVSYHDTTTFRRLFARAVGMTPSDYRHSFAGT
jgi:transcriptional regulator GlxA family with amidase domain